MSKKLGGGKTMFFIPHNKRMNLNKCWRKKPIGEDTKHFCRALGAERNRKVGK